MTRSRRRLWFAAYVVLVALPLAIAWLTDPLPAPRSPLADIGVAFGFFGLALLLVQFALVSRLRPVSSPFGSDALMHWHRGMGIAALAFVAAHPLLLPGAPWRAWNPFAGAAATQTGAVALWVTVAIVLTSVGRKRLRLSYELWQVVHLLSACVITVMALWHVLDIDVYSSAAPLRLLLLGYAGLFVALLVRYRIIRPLQLLTRPWKVVSNDDIGGSVRLVRVAPVAHRGIQFESGQFAWLITGSTPVFSAQHPLSLASSAAPADAGALEFAVKALGDWSGTTVPSLEPGRRVWVDGPFGGFTPDPASNREVVFIAGGIGIAPIRSMLLTREACRDRRPTYLFYAASDWSRVVFRDELERLADALALRTCYVFEKPDERWMGERGFVTAAVLARHLQADLARFEYFICGPVPMMDALEGILATCGVPAAQVHTERFQMV